MDDIAEQFARRDRVRRYLAQRETRAERLAAMARLQAQSWRILTSNPVGYAAFMRRNFKRRAVDVDLSYVT